LNDRARSIERAADLIETAQETASLKQDATNRIVKLEAELAEMRSRTRATMIEINKLRWQLESSEINGCEHVQSVQRATGSAYEKRDNGEAERVTATSKDQQAAAEEHTPIFAAELERRDVTRRLFVTLARDLFGGNIRAEMTLLDVLSWTHARIRELERMLDQMEVEQERFST
jgi:cell division septum initiation protein DivIVA